jgi:two-component system response regulator YesN
VDTSLSVKEVAQKLCFSDEYYFSNIFKEKVGCSPSQYRKRHTESRP